MTTQTREEQKAVLDAAWNGVECEYRTRMLDGGDGPWCAAPKLRDITWAIELGIDVRIKPKADPYAELKSAHAAGMVIEFRCEPSSKPWVLTHPKWDCPVDHYRIRPEPELVPLEAYDIPPVCWLRIPDVDGDILVTAVYKDCVFAGHGRSQPYSEMMNWECSPDRINWKPCSKPKP